MKCFIVVFGDKSADAEQSVKRQFPDHCRRVGPGQAWVVAAEDATCSDVAERLGMHSKGERNGIVVQLEEYNGFYARSLWEKIDQWQTA